MELCFYSLPKCLIDSVKDLANTITRVYERSEKLKTLSVQIPSWMNIDSLETSSIFAKMFNEIECVNNKHGARILRKFTFNIGITEVLINANLLDILYSLHFFE